MVMGGRFREKAGVAKSTTDEDDREMGVEGLVKKEEGEICQFCCLERQYFSPYTE